MIISIVAFYIRLEYLRIKRFCGINENSVSLCLKQDPTIDLSISIIIVKKKNKNLNFFEKILTL